MFVKPLITMLTFNLVVAGGATGVTIKSKLPTSNHEYIYKDTAYSTHACLLVWDFGGFDNKYNKASFQETITTAGMTSALQWVNNTPGPAGYNIANWLYNNTPGFKNTVISIQEGYKHLWSDDTYFHDLKADHSASASKFIATRRGRNARMKVNTRYVFNTFIKDDVGFTLSNLPISWFRILW